MSLLSLVLALLLLDPLSRVMDDALPFNLGDPLLNSWIIAWTADRLPHGLVGVWDPPIFYPDTGTLAFSEHLLGVTMLVAPVYWISGNGILAHNVAVTLSFVIAAVSMFLLAHALTGRRDAAVLIALAFAFCPLRVGGQLARVQMMMAGWLPLAFWGLHRYGATGRGRFLAAATGGYLMLALSNVYLACYSLPGLAIIGIDALRHLPAKARPIRDLALAGGAVAIVLVPIAAEYATVQKQYRIVRPHLEIDSYSATVLSYVSVDPASPLGSILPTEKTADQALFPGFVLLTFAALAFAPRLAVQSPVPGRYSRFNYVLVAAVSFLLSFGPTMRWSETDGGALMGPYAWLLRYVPGVEGLRVPARFGVVVVLALAALATIGAARLLAGRSPLFRTIVISAAVLAMAVEGYGGPLPIARFSPTFSPGDRQAYEWLAHAPPGAILELPVTTAATLVTPGAGVRPTLRYQYAALEHRHPLINGASGFATRFMGDLDVAIAPWTEYIVMEDILSQAHQRGARYVVVHRNDYLYAPLSNAVVSALRASALVECEREFGATLILGLRPDPPGNASRSITPCSVGGE